MDVGKDIKIKKGHDTDFERRRWMKPFESREGNFYNFSDSKKQSSA